MEKTPWRCHFVRRMGIVVRGQSWHCSIQTRSDNQMARLIDVDDIVILENRQRQEFDPVKCDEIRESIATNGLLHAPVLRDYLDQKVLVAGETRIKCIKDLWALGGVLRFDGKEIPEGKVPYVSLGELSELEAEEAELDENIKRKDLTWQEHAAAVARLHSLRGKQAAKATTDSIKAVLEGKEPADGLPAGLHRTHTVADTAKEVYGRDDGAYHDLARKEILVAQHIATNPAVAKAKNVDEAFKLLKREEERKKNEQLAAAVGASFNSSYHRAYNVNCLDWMALEENRSQFDVILTDPPYGMGADNFGDGAGRMSGIEHHYDDSPESWRDLMSKWCPLAYQVAKTQAHAYVFCDMDRFHELRDMMRKAGWYVFRTPFIVHKINSGRVPLPDKGPRRQYEILLYAIKGDKTVTHIYPDVIPCKADENMSHGAQKPVELYKDLLMRSVRAGDKVLDCFSGSGTIFPAAHTFKVSATGLEMNPEYYGMGLKRIQELS
jgi:DNA modification methylase/ParB-like chromosome segregation protein Spo0J